MRLPTAQLVATLLMSAAVQLGCARSKTPLAASDHVESPEVVAEVAPAETLRDGWPAAAAPARGATREPAKADDGYARARNAEVAYDHPSPPQRRPGLATQWGERRESSVQEVSFVRSDANPFAVLSFHYDDEEGITYKTGRNTDDALPGVFSVRGGAIEVSIVSPSDRPLPQLQARGKTYIVGDSDDRYAIRLTNFTRERYEVVASVDGLDVLTGTEAHYQKRGYILAPWSTLHIEGFRESSESVRAFRFGDIEDSYAIGRGYGRDIGVIGVALFDERAARRRPADDPSPFPGQYAPPPRY